MLILLDTSTLVWWMNNDDRLGTKTKDMLSDGANQIVVSSISILEYEIKSRLRKLPPIKNFKQLVYDQHFSPISYTVIHAEEVYDVPQLSWKDPFDLALIGQAKALQAHLLTSDKKMLAELSNYILCINART